MNDIEKIIFDTLASGRGINLPGIGSLSVERYPAEMQSDGRIIPPHGKVAFSTDESESFGSAALHQGYASWLQQASCANGILEIKGVGVLREGVFYPSVELHEKLNPQGTEPLAVKKAGQRGRLALWITIAAGAVVLAVTAYICLPDRERHTNTVAAVADRTETPKAETTEVVPAADNTATDNEQTDAAAAENLPEATPTAEDVIQEQLENYAETSTAEGVSYLVVGVFSDPANADKLIARDPLGIGTASYAKVPFKGGKTLVSAFSSTDRAKVEARHRELSRRNNELWVYEAK